VTLKLKIVLTLLSVLILTECVYGDFDSGGNRYYTLYGSPWHIDQERRGYAYQYKNMYFYIPNTRTA